jgi:hypothetical protein
MVARGDSFEGAVMVVRSNTEPLNGDMQFVLLEIGKLSSNVERLITDVKTMGDKVDNLRHQVTFMRGMLYVLSGVVAIGVYLLTSKWGTLATVGKALSQ